MAKKGKLWDKITLPKFEVDSAEITEDTESLTVQLVATHSGYLINNRVYPGVRVKDSYKTFFSAKNGGSSEYDKPVLLHHKSGAGWSDAEDPIGRVVGGEFVQIKKDESFEKDYLKPDTGNKKGSGYVVLDVKISDSDAIKKILDGRYSTVSIGAIPDAYYCSVCGKEFNECDHFPGEVYEIESDKKKTKKVTCYGITGDLNYVEVSFVNVPADPRAKVIKTAKDSVVTSLVLKDAEGSRELLSDTKETTNIENRKYKSAEVGVGPSFEDPFSVNTDVTRVGNQADPEAVEGPAKPKTSEKKEIVVDKTDDKKELSLLRESLESMSEKNKNLTKELETTKSEVDRLTSTVSEKDEKINKLQEKLVDQQADMSQVLAESYLNTRFILNKPDTIGIESKEDFDEAVKKYASRSVDSLKDSIEDLVPELSDFRENRETDQTVDTTQRVDSPVLQEPKADTTPDPVERFFKGD